MAPLLNLLERMGAGPGRKRRTCNTPSQKPHQTHAHTHAHTFTKLSKNEAAFCTFVSASEHRRNRDSKTSGNTCRKESRVDLACRRQPQGEERFAVVPRTQLAVVSRTQGQPCWDISSVNTRYCRNRSKDNLCTAPSRRLTAGLKLALETGSDACNLAMQKAQHAPRSTGSLLRSTALGCPGL
jgi:hypothetical protein